MRRNDLAAAISLDGEWDFAFGDGPWGAINVPGTWEAQNFLTRAEGPGHYRRTVAIPADWAGRSIDLCFDAVSYYVEARVNGQPIGTHQGMWTPFAFDITQAAQPGADNVIELAVTKPGGERFPLRESLAGFLPDVAIPFGGVWQSARLVAHGAYAITDLHIMAERETGEVAVRVHIAHPDNTMGHFARLAISDPQGNRVISREQPIASELVFRVTVPEPIPWSPDNPTLYTAEISIDEQDEPVAASVILYQSFGFRDLRAEGRQLLFNGAPVNLRGALHWGWYPDLLCPAPDASTIRDEFRKVRALGINLIKLCLYVPSQRYFDLADQEGMLLWLEFPLWLPEMSPALREQAPAEYADIMALARNHPSVVLVSLGCELSDDVDAAFVDSLARAVNDATDNILLCDNSGSGEAYGAPPTDASEFYDYHFYCDLHYFDPLIDTFRRDWRTPRPWLFGEFCDADDFRDTDATRAAYEGTLPWWLTEQNPIHAIDKIAYSQQDERMARLNLPYTNADLRDIAWRQSFMIRKTILEKVRARAGMGGYVLTSLKDNPLATSALFDDFMQPKYDPAAFRQFNADSVLLLGQGRAREWRHGGDRPKRMDMFNREGGSVVRYNVLLAHVGEQLAGGQLRWRITDMAEQPIAQGEQACHGPLPTGDPGTVGVIEFELPRREDAYSLVLTVELDAGDSHLENRWSLWVYPPVDTWPEVGVLDPAGCLNGLDDLYHSAQRLDEWSDDSWPPVVIASVITPALLAHLRTGGRVLLLQTNDRPLPALAVPFWREAIKLVGDHPVMQDFPHAGYVDQQFYHLAGDHALDTARLRDVLPEIGPTRSLLGRLDARLFTWTDYLVEVQVGQGTLIASTLRFMGGQGDQVKGLRNNVAGRFLVHNMLSYLAR